MPHSSVSKTDLVIIGAGPAGLMAAAWASKYKVATRFIDDKPGRVQTGHADGLTCRTMEIFDSFGLADTIVRESWHDVQMRSWVRGETQWRPRTRGHGEHAETRHQQVPAVYFAPGTNRAAAAGHEHVDQELAASEQPDVRPITLTVQHITPRSAAAKPGQAFIDPSSETIHAKYIIACDGAHSWTRSQVGLELKGDTTNAVWGVLDIVPLTNFPDIRQTCVIHSKDHGAIHLVPREGRLVRFYIQLAEADTSNQRFDRSSVSPAMLLQTVQKVFAPYELDCKICDWWSVYQVGQRIADDLAVYNRIFLAGDAIHTHSPKVGQGMNVSMADSYNLSWKVCSVLNHILRPAVLSTYQTERRGVALALLDADRATSKYYSVQRDEETNGGPRRKDLQSFRDEMYDFLSGVAVEHGESIITHPQRRAEDHGGSATKHLGLQTAAAAPLCSKIKIGQRMASCLVTNVANARPTLLWELLRSTGSWRVLVFAGDLYVAAQMQRLQQLGARLVDAQSCLERHIGSAVEVFTIVANKRDEVPLLDLPEVFHPWDEQPGWDYGKVFADETCVDGVGGGDS